MLRYRNTGMTLLELLVALLLTAILVLGLVHMVTAATAGTLLQDNQAQLQDIARQAETLLRRAVNQAGYRPEPWNSGFDIETIAAETTDGISAHSDRLVLRDWSDLNCFDNRNPDTDVSGRPRFYLRESTFALNGSGHLAHRCRYGPSDSDLVTQVRNQGLLPGVESFQLLFGEDSDGEGNIDRWVRAGQWSTEPGVMAVRVGLLLAGPDAVAEPEVRNYRILDTTRTGANDGRLRAVLDLTLAVRGRGE